MVLPNILVLTSTRGAAAVDRHVEHLVLDGALQRAVRLQRTGVAPWPPDGSAQPNRSQLLFVSCGYHVPRFRSLCSGSCVASLARSILREAASGLQGGVGRISVQQPRSARLQKDPLDVSCRCAHWETHGALSAVADHLRTCAHGCLQATTSSRVPCRSPPWSACSR